MQNNKTNLQVLGCFFPQQRKIFSQLIHVRILNLEDSSAFHDFPSLDAHISFWWITCIQPNDADQIMEQK